MAANNNNLNQVNNPDPNPGVVPPVEPAAAPTFHSAHSVSNIKNQIPLTLDLHKVQYHTWAELFQVAASAYAVLHHIDGSARPAGVPDDKWKQLDSIVLSWIYATISEEVLLTIIKSGSAAREAWLCIKALFHNNQYARAADLESKFINSRLAKHPNIASYCQSLKSLADQLADVGHRVSDQRLTLQLINGLSSDYDIVGSLISQITPLPDFTTACSMLSREETRKGRDADPQQAFVSSDDLPLPPTTTSSHRGSHSGRSQGRGGRNGRRPHLLPQ